MELSENDDMKNHLNTMLSELVALGEALKDKMIIALIFYSLLKSYIH